MATFVKTKRGWKSVVRRTGWPTQSKSFATKREAEDWSKQVEVEMTRGVFVDRAGNTKLNLAAALARYQSAVTVGKKLSTQKAEIGRVKSLTEDLGRYALTSLTPQVVSKYRDQLTAAGLAPDTVRLRLALLSNLFTIANREWGLGLARNPCLDVTKPRSIARDRRLEPAELQRLFSEVRAHSNPMLAWIVELLYETAMRKSELLTLELRDVDVTRRIVRLSDTKSGTPRTVPLTPRAALIFAEAIANPLRPAGCTLLWPGQPGLDGTVRPYEFTKLFVAAVKAARLKDFRLHDLRHEATSRLVERGLSDQQVSAITGHKSMQMLRRYTHLRAEDLVALLS